MLIQEHHMDNVKMASGDRQIYPSLYHGKKLVIVGNSTVGKTSLLLAYTSNRFPENMPTTAFDNFTVHMSHEGMQIPFTLCDSAGQEMFERIRHLSYMSTHIVVLCFSIACRKSFEDVKKKWIPEISVCCPRVPFLLVGTKCDLREDQATLDRCSKTRTPLITTEEGEALGESIRAVMYIETSARTQFNVKETFQTAFSVAMSPPEIVPANRKCCSVS